MSKYAVAVYNDFNEINKIEVLSGETPEEAIEKHSLLSGYEDVAEEITEGGGKVLKDGETFYFNFGYAISYLRL